MPDFLAGQTLTALHFPPRVTDDQPDSFTFNATTFGIDADSGTYLDCGVAFLAGATGRATVYYTAQMVNSGASFTSVTPVVREGSTVGSGSVFLAASDENCIQNNDANSRRFGGSVPLDGLTPGATYNVRLEHRCGANTGTILRRRVIVKADT